MLTRMNPRRGGVGRQQEHRDHARTGDDGRPDPHGVSEPVRVEQSTQEERTGRAHDVFGRKDDPVGESSVVDGETFAQGQGRGTVQQRGPEGGQDPLRGHEVPRPRAERGQDETERREGDPEVRHGASQVRPSSTESREQKWHAEVDDTVGRRTYHPRARG